MVGSSGSVGRSGEAVRSSAPVWPQSQSLELSAAHNAFLEVGMFSEILFQIPVHFRRHFEEVFSGVTLFVAAGSQYCAL